MRTPSTYTTPDSPPPLPAVDPLLKIVGRTRRRVRLQRALEGAATWAVAGVALVGCANIVLRLEMVEPWLFWRAVFSGALLLMGGALLGAVRPLKRGSVARRIDQSHQLHDRVNTALEFALAEHPSAFMVAQVEDALTHAPRLSPGLAAPLAWPRRFRALALALGMVGATLLIQPAGGEGSISSARLATLPGMEVDPDDLLAQRALVESMRQEALDDEVPDAAALAQELEQMLAQLERRELTRKALFEQLAALERKYLESQEGDFEELLRQLKKAGGELAKERPSRQVGEALQQEKLAKASQELKALAERLKELDRAAQRRLGKRLDRAARQPNAGDPSLERQQRALNQERRRLRRKQEAGTSDPRLRRRLKRNQRQLERLNREANRRQAQRRQLERLNRNLSKAAASLRDRMSDEARKALQQAAQESGRMARQVNRSRMLKRAQAKVQDLKEMLRRSGKGNKGNKGKLQDFYARAGDGKDKGKGKGNKKGVLLKPGGSGGAVMMEGDGQGRGESQITSVEQVAASADGVGQGAGGGLKGEKTSLDGKRRASLVQGTEGKGQSRSEVILGAAEDGFAARDYRQVFSAYNAVVEDVLKREDVPLGYRYYVKRYFQLIRPR